jgi:Tfp pilus assembly protein PilF
MKKNLFGVPLAGTAVVFFILLFLIGMAPAETGDIYFEQGTRFLKETRLEQAIWAFTEAIRLAPDRAEVYTNRGLAYLEQKKYPEAKQDFLKALEIAPNDVNANNNLGVFYCGRGDYDGALRYIRRAAGVPTLSGPYGAIVYRNLGFLYTKKGMPEEAGKTYDKARRMMGSKPLLSPFDRREYAEGSQDYPLALEFKKDSGNRE